MEIPVGVALIVGLGALILSCVVLILARNLKREGIKLNKQLAELDPQKIAERAIKNLKELPKDIQEQIREIIRSETENLNDRLEKNKTEIEAQKEKLNNLRSRIGENGRKIINSILNVLKEVFEPSIKEILREPEKIVLSDESSTKEISDDEETVVKEQISTNEETNNTDSEQQTVKEEVPDDT